MPAFFVELLDLSGYTLPEGARRMVVNAQDATEAAAVAGGHFGGDSNAAWAAATVTAIADATADFTALTMILAVPSPTPFSIRVANTANPSVTGGAINAAGSGYVAGNIVTLGGGTATRAATFRVVSETAGVPDVIELVDPGVYTVAPSAAEATTGGAGTGLTINSITTAANTLEGLLAEAVTQLNAQVDIAGAAVDMGAGTNPLLTVASGSGGDDLGDLDLSVSVVFGVDDIPVPSFINTVTDLGVSTAVLSVDFDPTVAIPAVIAAF
jgi:hypothetical protein